MEKTTELPNPKLTKEKLSTLTDEILEGNKLIAEFMGMQYKQNCDDRFVAQRTVKGKQKWVILKFIALQYHCNWSWLMPVVEKIEGLGVEFTIRRNFIELQGFVLDKMETYRWNGGSTSESKLISAWHGVVQFIKYYNSNKK